MRPGSIVGIAAALSAATAACDRETHDPCAGVECSGRGYCLADQGDAYCACLPGFHPAGLQCVANDPADPCRGVDCSGHGDCRRDGDDPTCDCDPGYRHLLEGDPRCAGTECDLLCIAEAAGADADAGGGADADASDEAGAAEAGEPGEADDDGGGDDDGVALDDGADAPDRADGAGEDAGGDDGSPEAEDAADEAEDGAADGCSPDCAFGCPPGEPRCYEFEPSNLAEPGVVGAGLAAFEPSVDATLILFDTDSGAIEAFGPGPTTLPAIRGPGVGTVDRIPFAVQAQPAAAPELAIWSFTDFHVPVATVVVGAGPRAMVVAASGPVTIDGIVDLSGSTALPTGPYLPAAAGAGGEANAAGGGLGAGGGGGYMLAPRSGGGGGGGFGGPGGAGGAGGVTGPPGTAGTAYGAPDLVPLAGGSGGGGGGSDDVMPAGGPGGAGGGALQFVSLTGITISEFAGINAGGKGGRGAAGGTGGGGGGGGGSGGAVLLEAPRIVVAGGIAANGGGGGGAAGPTSMLPAGDGQGGRLSDAAAAGGAGSGLGGSGEPGGPGSSGSSGDGADGASSTDYSGGGGGGGAGRIRLNALEFEVAGLLSPAESTELATRGDPRLR
jgi:hypothetical protein